MQPALRKRQALRAQKLVKALWTSALGLAVLAILASLAWTQINGFGGDGAAGNTLNGSPIVTGGATPDDDVLQLTDSNNTEGRSLFNNTLQSYANGFTAQFTYQNNGTGAGNLADGAAFILQNDPRGATALGDTGGALGYGGGNPITSSVAFEMNIYQPNTIGTSFRSNGFLGGYTAPGNGVNLDSGHPISITLTYNPATYTMTQKLVDGANIATTSYPVILTGTLKNNGLAYVGFSGGTGGVNSTQTVTKYSYTPAAFTAAPITLQDGFNAPDGTALNGHLPELGTLWTVSVDSAPGALQINGGEVNTAGAARVATTGFGLSLSSGHILLVTLREENLGNFFGFLSGWDLLVGNQTELFFGSVNGSTQNWSVASDHNGTNLLTSTSNFQGADVALEYAYDTGATSLFVNNQQVISGTMPSNLAIDGFGFENNNGGDVKFGDLQAAILVPEPSAAAYLALGIFGFIRRRKSSC